MRVCVRACKMVAYLQLLVTVKLDVCLECRDLATNRVTIIARPCTHVDIRCHAMHQILPERCWRDRPAVTEAIGVGCYLLLATDACPFTRTFYFTELTNGRLLTTVGASEVFVGSDGRERTEFVISATTEQKESLVSRGWCRERGYVGWAMQPVRNRTGSLQKRNGPQPTVVQ